MRAFAAAAIVATAEAQIARRAATAQKSPWCSRSEAFLLRVKACLAVLGLAAALSACATPCATAPPLGERLSFACADGSSLSVTFSAAPSFARVEQAGLVTLTLPARSAGLGYRYAGAGAELRGRAGAATWFRPGAGETLCRTGQS